MPEIETGQNITPGIAGHPALFHGPFRINPLSGIFAAHGIEVAFQPMRVEQTTQERLKIAVSDLQLKINGRLN